MSAQSDVTGIMAIATGLDNNKVANFAYDDAAFAGDMVAGVATFDATVDQNVPDKDNTDLNPTVLIQGFQTEAASIPRRAANHFFGRISYNLNKLVNKFIAFLTTLQAFMAHNTNEYDASATYAQGDICYVTAVDSPYTRTMYINSSAAMMQGVQPPNTGWSEVTPSIAGGLSPPDASRERAVCFFSRSPDFLLPLLI